jgi:D-alanyl-D-alanine carboxypeptidase/D-alanyl-D-alanine-endopeptidase (penicillin-binding protein 4)
MKFKASYLSLCLITICMTSGAIAKSIPPAVSAALKRAGIPDSAVGLTIQEVTGSKALLSHNPNEPMSPASTMKLVTSDAALELLGPAFTWKTQAYVSGIQTGDVLQGDLIIKGSGDPKLVIENFWLFMRQIRAKGIREINGNLILDRSIFEDRIYDSATFDGDPLKPYNAGPDALLLNFKAFRFQFTPDIVNGLVNVLVDPNVTGYEVAAPKLTRDDCGDWQQKLRATIDERGANFSGTFSALCGEKAWYLHPYQLTQSQYFGIIFRQIWRELGGTFKGLVRDGIVPQDARLVTQWESVTLPEVVRDINKFSNNVMARQLLLTVAAKATQQPASRERGADTIKAWLINKGIDAPELVIENGSGLSRNERISVDTMARVLVSAFRSPTMPEFISSMPLVGYDGTMRQRLHERSVAGNAHIKTGSLNEVRAIAGYVLAASGKRYAVVFFINHGNAARGQEAQDILLQWIYEHG